MANITGVHAGSGRELVQHWWQWVLLGLTFGSVLIGSSYIIYSVVRKLRRRIASKDGPSKALAAKASSHLQKYAGSRSQLTLEKSEKQRPTSLAVYLGAFDAPNTFAQTRLLSTHDTIILNPLEKNVMSVVLELRQNAGTPINLIGRLDLETILKVSQSDSTKEMETSLITGLDEIMTIVTSRFQDSFTAILLAGWETLPTSIFIELSDVLSTLGLGVYLETSAPDFLKQSTILGVESVTGIVIRNGLILPDGQRRDCFGMENLRTTIKAFVSQACLRDFNVLAWETLDDGADLPSAVLRRTFTWCGFYSVVPWIGPQSALYDASVDTARFQPLSAFDWLKQARVMELQKTWKVKKDTPNTTPSHSEIEQFASVLPTIQNASKDVYCQHEGQMSSSKLTEEMLESPELSVLKDSLHGDALSNSSIGNSADGLGCFPLGLELNLEDFRQIVASQKNLAKLNLLDVATEQELQEYGNTIQQFLADSTTSTELRSPDSHLYEPVIAELAKNLKQSPDEEDESVRVFRGLPSGLQRNNKKHFWGVYQIRSSGDTDIYISKNLQDPASVLIHTYMAARGLQRRLCFAAEVSFARWQNRLVQPHDLPPRLVQDVRALSPEESIHLLQRIQFSPHSNNDQLLQGIKSAITERLVDIPTMNQLKLINTVGYLNESVDKEEVIRSRVQWHCQSRRPHPSVEAAVALFNDVESLILSYLKSRDHQKLSALTDVLQAVVENPAVEAVGDIFALAVFCTMRKVGMQEVYVEVTDRNPLFNDQADQAAAFSELFALGSRCEAYFDVSPSQFGQILSQRFRDYYSKDENQPPQFVETAAGLNTAYTEAGIDVDTEYTPNKMPMFQRFTFMSVFAIPALIDIMLLTSTGHGLYLSSGDYMTGEEVHSATTALMISLLLSGAIGTWIACGGTYYMASMAFSAMNYFVITRLLGGFALTLIAGVIGFIAFFCTTGAHAAVVFFFYLIILTSYLCLLAALANYQFTGSAFQSGRGVIIIFIPVLFISPITTMFVKGHDIKVYLTVLFVFVTLLLLGVRYIGSRWTTWYQKIQLISDAELRSWYIEKMTKTGTKNNLSAMPDPAILREARKSLKEDVIQEKNKSFFGSKSQDPTVSKLAESFEATGVVMDWYCRTSGVPHPIMFSSTWNMSSKVALNSLQKTQLGIRFHNGFLHWRQAGDEIGCTMLYFIVALLDKWIVLLSGGGLVGLASAGDLVMPIGLGLAYYLIGAVLLDANAHKLNELAAKNEEKIVPTDGDIAGAVKAKSANLKKIYWQTLMRYLLLHVWGLAITSTLLWLFTTAATNSQGVLVFLSYVVAYTGVLWYQYTKIFTGPHALKPLLVGVIIGFPLGFILRSQFPKFIYADIIALGVATWTVAILSLWAAKILGPPEKLATPRLITGKTYRAYSSLGPDQAWSQPELQGLLEQLSELPEGQLLPIDPSSEFGNEVQQILTDYSHAELSQLAERAFPEAAALLRVSKAHFSERMVTIQLVALGNFSKYQNMRAVSSIDNAKIRVIFGCDITALTKNEGLIPGFVQDIAELLIQVAAEYHLKYSARDAFIVQSLWTNHDLWTNEFSGPSLLERQLKIFSKTGDPNDLLEHLKKELAQDLCLGFDCDLKWDKLPDDFRQALMQRCLGNATPFGETQLSFLKDNLGQIPDRKINLHLARCDYSVYSNTVAIRRARSWISGSQSLKTPQSLRHRPSVRDVKRMVNILEKPYSPPKLTFYDLFLKYSGIFYHSAGTLCKFLSIAFVADPEFQREMKCTFGNSKLANGILGSLFLLIWKWSQAIQRLLLPTFLLYGRPKVETIWKNLQGSEVSIKRKRILIRRADGVQTGFIHTIDGDTFRLLQYKGDHKTEPTNNNDLCATNMYSKDMALLRRVEMNKGNTIHDFEYQYRVQNPKVSRRLSRISALTSPITREETSGGETLQVVEYNARGQIDSGSYMKDGNLVRFQYHYQKSTKQLGALLRAEYVLPHMSCTVCWSAPPRRKAERLESWIPHDQVIEASFVVGADVWECQYYYDHKHHPTIITTLNGEQVETPALIREDHLDVLKKPQNVSFVDENPLHSFKSVKSNIITRWLGMSTRHYPMSTAQARSCLWKAWKDDPSFDGVIARWLDERLLRRESILAPYWRKRDLGLLKSAETYLDENRDAVMATVDLDSTISSWTPLAIKINDLYSFGQGGDACSRTRSNVAEDDDTKTMHVVAVDTGTWPNEGGGVSACRRDVVNNLQSIKWHMVAESANDFGIPKNQIERNVHSLKIIPLWGLDLMTPTHGLFTNRLDSEIAHLATHTTLIDIEQTFVPILSAIVNGSRAQRFDIGHIKQLTRSLINLNDYFKDSQNWSAVWQSDVVKSAWRKLWLSQDTPNARPSSQWLKTELPTLGQLDQGLDLWSRYLFIFSIPVPEKMPAVFQTSHHSVSASYGIVCKIKRGCTLQIWDHAISWRETNLYLSSALCSLSPFTRNSLLGLMRMTSVLILHHADTILPCADFFNPGWEAEIGTCEGTIEHPAAFRRKIDPVVNGITNIERFTPVKEIKTTVPTVTMLSHIWFAKDIKTALLAADIIINKWGFKDYKLEIYGALDKTPSYTTSCQEIVATKSLRGQVQLCGEANPIDVLQRTWVFLNSSISEGLPLALGEAALTGAPVVCTDVGASLRVLTNQEDNTCYSEVVAPNDALAMARAQIKILGMLEEWDKYADKTAYSPGTEDASFPVEPTAEDIARITRRMYEQAEARRKLGMMSREIVQKAFSGDRYLREHEQMLWIGKARKTMSEHRSKRLSPSARLRPPQKIMLQERPSSLVQMRNQSNLRDSYQRDSSQIGSFRDHSFRTNSPYSSSLRNVSLPSLAFSTEGGAFQDVMLDSTSLSSVDTRNQRRPFFHRNVSSNSVV